MVKTQVNAEFRFLKETRQYNWDLFYMFIEESSYEFRASSEELERIFRQKYNENIPIINTATYVGPVQLSPGFSCGDQLFTAGVQ